MDSYNALMTSLYNARWNDMCEPKTLDDIFEAIRKAAADNSLNNTKIVVIDSIGEIEDIIISEATKGKFGIFIKNSNLDFQQIIPELEANSYLVDNYGDYIGIYW